jgi:hypothetical protein
VIRISKVEPLAGYQLRLTFTDGTSGVVDIAPQLRGPMFEPLVRDPALFRAVRVDPEIGTIVWPNGADLDPDVLRARALETDSDPDSDPGRQRGSST